MKPVARARHTVILLIILAALSVSTYRANAQRPAGRAPQHRIVLYVSVIGAETLLLWYVVSGLSGVALRDLIGRVAPIDILTAAAFWFVARYAMIALKRALGGVDDRTMGLTPQSIGEKVAWVAVSIVAGVVEETVFRGYFQRQFAAWTQSVAAGVVLQAIIFGASHGYQGVKPMIGISVYGAMFGLLAWWRRSLVPGMLAHLWTDIYGGFF
ncbi:MAG TPA: CPBP family intramembrane glutamic endopeptidase [Thermoanaerobaculia bacterium]|jgi:membrane protease YdiL (CAAX protease family)